MNEKFVASNGVEVHINGYSQLCIGRGVPTEQTQAAREFFQHERDTGLGRWRWPDDPRYQGCEPTNPDLWEPYEDGKADGYVERRRNERGV